MKTGFKNRRFDFILLFFILTLLGIGVMMMSSSSFVRAGYLKGDAAFFMLSQFKYAILGIVVMIAASFVDYKIYKRFAGIFLAVVIVLNVVTAFFGATRNDATRWFQLGPISFQPSEFLKVALILYLASVLSDEKLGEKSKGWFGFISVVAPFGMALLSVLLQKHASATIIIALIGLTLMLIAGMKWYVYGISALAGGLGVAAISLIKPDLFEHVANRLNVYRATVFGNTSANPEGLSPEAMSQIKNSLWAIGSGGLTGAGIGKSVQKYSYLPEAYNDFIFAITAEEIGFLGVTVIIILYALLIIRGFKVSYSCPDSFGSLVSAGIVMMITIQVIFNLSVVSALIPVTGVGLPFFSFGGSAIVIVLGSMGVLLNIAKQSDYAKF